LAQAGFGGANRISPDALGLLSAPCETANYVFSECARRQPKLLCDNANQRLRRVFTWPKTLAGVAQQAELDCKAKTVRGAAVGSDEHHVVGGEDLMPRHLDAPDGNGEQAIALLGGQKGSERQGGLVAEEEGRS
jgi:hypothetical protein